MFALCLVWLCSPSNGRIVVSSFLLGWEWGCNLNLLVLLVLYVVTMNQITQDSDGPLVFSPLWGVGGLE